MKTQPMILFMAGSMNVHPLLETFLQQNLGDCHHVGVLLSYFALRDGKRIQQRLHNIMEGEGSEDTEREPTEEA